MELVRTGRQGRHAQRVEIDRDAADGLHGVGVHRDTPRRGQGRQLADRLDRAGLVVRQHQRGEPRVVAKRRGHARRVGEALGVDRHAVHREARRLQPGHRLDDRRVLDRAGDDVPRRCLGAGQAEDRQVVRLRPPGGEDHLGRLGAQDPRDRLLGVLPGAAGRPAEGVPALGVARRPGNTAASPPAPSGSMGVVALWSR